jgi:hypothetical protein
MQDPTANATSNSPVCVGGDINLSTPSAGTVQLIPGPARMDLALLQDNQQTVMSVPVMQEIIQ